MQFRDLKQQYMSMRSEMNEAIFNVIIDTNFISGRQVGELEKKLAEYVGVKHCISCGNGTDALNLALIAWGIGKGDAVFVPDFTFFSSGEVISTVGATPIFVDVDAETFNLDPEKLEIAIQRVNKEKKLCPKVIVAVDLFGQPADYERLRKIANKYGLFILEDGAQGFGGSINGRKACSFGDIATTSFFPAKPLGCYGDGGAIFVNDDDIAKVIRSLCVHGKGDIKYDNIRIGMNSRLDTIQAAILLVKFPKFIEYELESVNRIASMYTELLHDYVKTPLIQKGWKSSWAQYSIKLNDEEERNGLKDFLSGCNIPSMIYYPKPMHCQKAFSTYECTESLEIAERLCKIVLALPIHPYMKDDDVQEVANNVIAYLREKR